LISFCVTYQVDASFKFMKESLQDIDFIIYTGDTARHDRDDKIGRSKSDVLDDHKTVVNYFKKTYDVSTIKLVSRKTPSRLLNIPPYLRIPHLTRLFMW
jgi:hypothetical protein